MTRWNAARPPVARALPRPPSLARTLLLPILLLAALGTAAHADQIRSFPDAALRGRLEVVTPPAVQLDGRPDQLAMGARIRDTRNLFVTSGTLADGQTHVVNYLRNPSGQLSEVWLLTDDEAALRRPSGSPSWMERWFGF